MKQMIISVLIVLLALAGCREQAAPSGDDAPLQIELNVSPEEPAVGDAELRVEVTDADGAPVDDATVSARGDMSHAGMQPVLAETEGGEDGVYVLPFEWTMGGDWFVDVTATRPNGDTATARFEYSVSGDMGDMDDMDGDMSMDEPEATEAAGE